MKIKMGQPQRLKNQAERGSDRIKLGEGENVHRVLFGPVVVHTVFWPSQQRDDATGEIKTVTKSAKVADRGSIFDGIAALDRKIQRATGVDKPRSQLDKNTKFNYLVIDVDKEPLKVGIAQYPKGVKDALVELEEKRDTDDATKLRYGLIWMYNVIITKDVDPNKERRYGTDYAVEPDPKNPWLGQVPADWLKADFDTIVEGGYIDLKEVFSEEMMAALEEAEIDLEAEGVPDSEEVIMERLQAFPIDLNATRFDKPAFARPDLMAAELRELELPFLNPGKPGTEQALLPSEASKEEAAAEVAEEDFEVVDEPPSKKAKAKLKGLKKEEPEEVEEAEFEEVDDSGDGVPEGMDEDEDEGEKPTKLRSLMKKAKDAESAINE